MSSLAPLATEFPLKPVKFMAPLCGDKVDAVPTDGEYLGLEQFESWSGRLSGAELLQHPEGSANEFQKGDVLFGKLRPYLAKGWVADRAGFCTTESLVLRPRGVEPRFLRYCLLTGEVVSAIDGSTYGSKMPRADWGFIGNVYLPCPSKAEQERVANFLDVQTARIDALISGKKELVERLRELRNSHIAAEMCAALSTGTRQLRRALNFLGQGWSPVAESGPAAEGKWGVLKLSAVKSGVFIPDENKELSEGCEVPEGLRLRAGDVLVTRANTPQLVGGAALVDKDDYSLIPSDLIYTLRINPLLLTPQFLTLFLLSPQARAVIEVDARGSSQSMVKLSQEHIRSWQIPAISLAAQEGIVSRLTSHLARSNELQRHALAHLDRLNEYRSSLISAAVTGQIDISTFKVCA